MSEKLPYEEQLDQAWDTLPLPDEVMAWKDMKRRLDEDDDDRISYNSYNLGLSMACFLNKHISLELGVEYSSKKYEDEDSRVNRIGLCAGFQMHFSCEKKKKAGNK